MGFENLDVEDFSARVQSRFKAVSIVQKRIRELERGWPRLIVDDRQDIIQVALEEYRNGKIWLVGGEEAEQLRRLRETEERERARTVEAARRATELEAGNSPTVPKPGLSAVLGLNKP
jgi:DNA-directed RNA polymerase subunit K/omega